MMGRQMNGTSEGGPSLWKQGSLNLPTPDDSGFPATHPDMCILRIRRNHLLEVRRQPFIRPCWCASRLCLSAAQESPS
jgi:hypothetical protein